MFSLSPLVFLVTSSFTSSSFPRCFGKFRQLFEIETAEMQVRLHVLQRVAVKTLLRHRSRFDEAGRQDAERPLQHRVAGLRLGQLHLLDGYLILAVGNALQSRPALRLLRSGNRRQTAPRSIALPMSCSPYLE